MYDFTNVDPVKCCTWLVLPTVYDESLSYGEQLNKFCKALNELIENNNNIPQYVAEMIQNYITSGAIDEVVRNILANYILNVKYPPKGITPAVGDGSADDTDAIQGCIDYAFNQGGGCVYFPYGKYLTRSLTLRSGVSLVGFDRYSTRIVQRGGDTKPLVSGGNVQNVQISNLTLDGNNEVQTDDLDVVNVLGKDCLFTNLVIKSGFQCFVYNGLGGDLQVDNVVFGGAVKKVAVINGKDSVQFTNVKFNELGKVQGECVLEVGASDGVYSFSSKAVSPLCISVSGSRNTFNCDIINSSSNFNDTGMMNNFNVLGVEVKEQLAQGKSSSFGGSKVENITGDKTENITRNREIDVNGTDSVHVDGVSTVNIGGARTEIYGNSRNVGVTGTSNEVYHSTMSENFESKHITNGTDETNTFTGNVSNEANKFNFTSKEKSFPINFPDKVVDLYELKFHVKGFTSVIDFGAKGDGITDDTQSFKKAIEYCINNNVGLYVPALNKWNQEGGYILSETLNIDYPMVLICEPNSLLNWKYAHLNTDTTTYKGRNNSTLYKSGYGINIDYGSYRGHKGYYRIGVLQGDKTFTYPNGNEPSGYYWTGIRIANGDLVDYKAIYHSYWKIGLLVETTVDDCDNCRIEFDVTDDCETGIKLNPTNGFAISLLEVVFNTIGICKYGIEGTCDNNQNSKINNSYFKGMQIYVEYPNGSNLYNATEYNTLFEHCKFDITDLKNNQTAVTTLKTGDSSGWYNSVVTGKSTGSGFNISFGATDSEFNLGVYNGTMQAGDPVMIKISGENNTIINNWLKQNGTISNPINLITSELEKDFNGGIGGACTGIYIYAQYTTSKSYSTGDIIKLYGFAMCLTSSGLTPMSIEPLAPYSEILPICKSDTYNSIRRFTVELKCLSNISDGYNFKFLIKIN